MDVTPRVVAAIFARGGSKGVQRKNIRLLAGKPLIAYAIEAARAARSIQRVIVSTEDWEIADIARRYGAEVPFVRPAELATDEAPEWLAWQHAIRTLNASDGSRQIDVLVSVPATAPLRIPADIDTCVDGLLESDEADFAMTVTPSARNPYFDMVRLVDGYARPAVEFATAIHRRQDAPPVFDITPVAYAAWARFILEAGGLFEGRVKGVCVPPERAIDINTELDLRIAEFLITSVPRQR